MLSILYPPHCAACDKETTTGGYRCAECATSAHLIERPFCQKCSEPFFGEMRQEFTCANCRERHFRFKSAIARYRFEGVVRDFVHRFKYQRHFYLRHQLAEWLATGLLDPRIQAFRADGLVPVPLHSARQREREFNQAEELARLVSRRSGIPIVGCLSRIRYTSTQTRLDRQERQENMRGAFRVQQPDRVKRGHFILIDDVFTTGSTVNECSRVLRGAGAASVRVMTVARG